MKSVVVYYSYSGNTRKVAEILVEYLAEKYETKILELKPLDESKNFFVQGGRAHKHIKAELDDVNFDLSSYDLICLGTPVWAFTSTPAINTYVQACTGLENKVVVLFTTSGNIGDKRCLDYLQGILSKKGAGIFKRFSIRHHKVKQKDFVLTKIKQALA
jgi:flavodoxin